MSTASVRRDRWRRDIESPAAAGDAIAPVSALAEPSARLGVALLNAPVAERDARTETAIGTAF